MGDSSVAAGALVLCVPKPDSAPSGGDAAAAQTQALAEDAGASASPSSSPEEGDGAGGEAAAAADKELLCPICLALIKGAFLTACGHSFCYMCIVTHLTHKSNCPCCSNYLTKAQFYPNFLLDKVRVFCFEQGLRRGRDGELQGPWLRGNLCGGAAACSCGGACLTALREAMGERASHQDSTAVMF